jgi:ankyrin repeat protein
MYDLEGTAVGSKHKYPDALACFGMIAMPRGRATLLLLLLVSARLLPPAGATIGADLINAAREGHNSEIERWLEHHSPHIKDSKGHTALMVASMGGHVHSMELLFKAGAKLNTRDRVRHTPMILAARDGRLEVVKWLIKNGANYNLKDNSNMSPMHWASIKGHHAVVVELVKAGAHPDWEDHRGRTPHDWALAQGHHHIADHLLEHGKATPKETRDAQKEEAQKDKERSFDAARAERRRHATEAHANNRAGEM